MRTLPTILLVVGGAICATPRPADACTCAAWEPSPGIVDGQIDVPRNTGFLQAPGQTFTLRGPEGDSIALDPEVYATGPAGDITFVRPRYTLEASATYELVITEEPIGGGTSIGFTTGDGVDETAPTFTGLEVLDAWQAPIDDECISSCQVRDRYAEASLDFELALAEAAFVTVSDGPDGNGIDILPAEQAWIDALHHLSTSLCSVEAFPEYDQEYCVEIIAYDLAGNGTALSACHEMPTCEPVNTCDDGPVDALTCVPLPELPDDDTDGDRGCATTDGAGAATALLVLAVVAALSYRRRRRA